jgi:hypothetical protein
MKTRVFHQLLWNDPPSVLLSHVKDIMLANTQQCQPNGNKLTSGLFWAVLSGGGVPF